VATEYGTGNSRVAAQMGTCFYPRSMQQENGPLCDRDRSHTGRHAAWHLDKRIYWEEADDNRYDAHRGPL
jgi:hypothetical protein